MPTRIMELPHIGLDIDNGNKKNLERVLKNCRNHFPNAEILYRESSSGEGYHIIIKKEVSVLENFVYRALLGDCPDRLIFSMRRWALDRELSNLDILFDEKNGEKSGMWVLHD